MTYTTIDLLCDLPRGNRPPNISDWVKRKLVRAATERSRKTLKVLERSTAQSGEAVHRTAITWEFHNTGL